jgi:hypothetical protein
MCPSVPWSIVATPTIIAAMTVSALVVLLSSDRTLRERALADLGGDARLTLGEAILDRLPLVAETTSAADGVALVDELIAHDGVVSVDVVSIDFNDEEPS